MPVSVIISFVFLCLDSLGERIEDPFENQVEGIPMTAMSLTIETNLKEHWGDKDFPQPQPAVKGVVL